MIGAVTFTPSLAGALLGDKLRRLKMERIGVLDGLILIAIGARILFRIPNVKLNRSESKSLYVTAFLLNHA